MCKKGKIFEKYNGQKSAFAPKEVEKKGEEERGDSENSDEQILREAKANKLMRLSKLQPVKPISPSTELEELSARNVDAPGRRHKKAGSLEIVPEQRRKPLNPKENDESSNSPINNNGRQYKSERKTSHSSNTSLEEEVIELLPVPSYSSRVALPQASSLGFWKQSEKSLTAVIQKKKPQVSFSKETIVGSASALCVNEGKNEILLDKGKEEKEVPRPEEYSFDSVLPFASSRIPSSNLPVIDFWEKSKLSVKEKKTSKEYRKSNPVMKNPGSFKPRRGSYVVKSSSDRNPGEKNNLSNSGGKIGDKGGNESEKNSRSRSATVNNMNHK